MNLTETIWGKYHSKLLAFIIKRVESTAEAEDLLQEVFIKVYTHVDSVAEGVNLEKHLYF